jgi:hypothetical protein
MRDGPYVLRESERPYVALVVDGDRLPLEVQDAMVQARPLGARDAGDIVPLHLSLVAFPVPVQVWDLELHLVVRTGLRSRRLEEQVEPFDPHDAPTGNEGEHVALQSDVELSLRLAILMRLAESVPGVRELVTEIEEVDAGARQVALRHFVGRYAQLLPPLRAQCK